MCSPAARLKYPLFDAFDAPDPNVTCPERNVSVNSPQALMLLNSELIFAFGEGVCLSRPQGGRERRSVGPGDACLSLWRMLEREPDSVEREKGVAFMGGGVEGKASR